MSRLVWILVVALVVLHQDNWFWTDGKLVFGFMPVGLFYHTCLSMASAGVWFLATQFCWPLEQSADASAGQASAEQAASESAAGSGESA